jgi:hypothetical protein
VSRNRRFSPDFQPPKVGLNLTSPANRDRWLHGILTQALQGFLVKKAAKDTVLSESESGKARSEMMADQTHKQPWTSLAVSAVLGFVLGPGMQCHCWEVYALAALFALYATLKAKGLFRMFSALILVWCLFALYSDYQGKLRVRQHEAREAGP